MGTSFSWSVDVRSLKSNDKVNDKVVVSPPFEIPHCASSIFKLVVKKRAGPSGKITIQLKCLTADQGAVSFRLVIKGKEELSYGPVTHDFMEAPLCSCKREWDLTDILGEAKQSFSMILEVLQ